MMAPGALRRRILYISLAGDRPRLMVWTTLLMLVVAIVGAVLGARIGLDKGRMAFQFGGTVLVPLAGTWWAAFCAGAARQNTPANARLVPGLNQVLRACALRVWLVVLAMVLPLAWSHPHGAILVPLFGFGFSGLGLFLTGRWDGLAVMLAAVLFYAFASMSASLMAILSHPAAVVLAMLACLAYARWALRAGLPTGGERHWANRRQQDQMKAMYEMKTWDQAVRHSGSRQRLFSRVLAGDLRGGRTVDLLLHGLGPRAHRYLFAPSLAVWAVTIVLLKPALVALGISTAGMAAIVAAPLAGGLVFALPVYWMRFASSMRTSAGEQAVLRLAPAAPEPSALNRMLGARIFFICAAEWSTCVLVALGSLWLWGATPAHYRGVAIAAALLLGATGYSLQDFARQESKGFAGYFFLLLWVFFLMSAGIVTSDNPLAWSGWFVLALATSLTYIGVRWHRMQRGRPAFPAGRFD